MANICEVCNLEFATPAALGSHKRKHREPKAKANSSEPIVVKLVVEQTPVNSNPQSNPYKCLECESPLELMADGPGIYKLRCQKCYEGGE